MSTQYWVYGYTCTCTNMKNEYSILGYRVILVHVQTGGNTVGSRVWKTNEITYVTFIHVHELILMNIR